MRGTPIGKLPTGQHDGIIPAYAGNTLHEVLGGELIGDHPRICGEHCHG